MATVARLEIVPIGLKQAQEFVGRFHRHNRAPQGHKFSIGLQCAGELIGVAIVGRPIARKIDDGATAEITRVCVLEGWRNANSKLYGACCRACKAMGYKSVITYTLKEESGSSILAAGFEKDGDVRLNTKGWDMPGRPREDQAVSHAPKQRWRRRLN